MDFSDLSFPDAPSIITTPPGPASQEILEYQSTHESSAVSYPRGMPMALRRAKGATIEDVDGNIYIDFFAGAGVMNVGHGNPAVIEAAGEQIGELTHTLDIPSPARVSMVEALCEVLPEELGKIFFGGPTGSDAVEAAMKLAKYNTGRYPMISFEGAYHGMTSGALSLCSGSPFKGDFLPLLPEVHFVPYSYCYRCPFNREQESCDLECGSYLEHVVEDSHSGVGKPAAIIVEAIQGEGGSIIPDERFLPKIREICDTYGIVMIVDEIQAGFCRTGKMFAVDHTGTIPDVMTLSKALGGVGFPIEGHRADLPGVIEQHPGDAVTLLLQESLRHRTPHHHQVHHRAGQRHTAGHPRPFGRRPAEVVALAISTRECPECGRGSASRPSHL